MQTETINFIWLISLLRLEVSKRVKTRFQHIVVGKQEGNWGKEEKSKGRFERENWSMWVSTLYTRAHSIVGSVCYYTIITVLTQLQQQLRPFIFQALNSFPKLWDFLGGEERNDNVRKQSLKSMWFISSEFGLIGSPWIRKRYWVMNVNVNVNLNEVILRTFFLFFFLKRYFENLKGPLYGIYWSFLINFVERWHLWCDIVGGLYLSSFMN